MYLGIEGGIGSGKSTLAAAIAEDFGWQWLPEPVDDNICLADFYADPKRWAFATQMYFMYVRSKMHMHASFSSKPMVIDRTLCGDRCFCRLHLRYGNIQDLEWKIYEATFDMANAVRAPSMMLYLDVDPEVSLTRIKTRGRGMESGITLTYLQDLAAEYEKLISDIESGKHAWSRGIQVLRLPWNDYYPDVRKNPAYPRTLEAIKECFGCK